MAQSNTKRKNKHLIDTFSGLSLSETRIQLTEAHDYLVQRCVVFFDSFPAAGPIWGIQMKRLSVDLASERRPAAIGKKTERFGEVFNMVATLERLIALLSWFENRSDFSYLRVRECHPSTSSAKGSNDLVLEDANETIVVRCEVSDVASTKSDSNCKETKDIKSLGCKGGVPSDGIRRFICTSPELSVLAQSKKRKWLEKQYRYVEYRAGDYGDTVVLELIPFP
jgi:hypothetical protein